MIEFDAGAGEICSAFICRNGESLLRTIKRIFSYSTDLFGGIENETSCMVLFSNMGDALNTRLGNESERSIVTLDKLIAALMMLWQSRPEFIVSVELPRKDRYDFRGDRKIIRTWKFPDKLIVRKPSDSDQTPTGRHVRAHWRAATFQHYRHERYSRNPDGSIKKTFIPACIVHADELESQKRAEAGS
jgi:hypothetical protein